MNKIKYSVLIVSLLMLFGGSVVAESQMDLNKAACDQLKKSDDLLNKTYQQVLQKYKDDKAFITQFVNTQKKWIQFKDAYVASMYLPEQSDSYGSALTMCQCNFIDRITQDRLKQLQVWVDGIEEGDVCVGTVHVK